MSRRVENDLSRIKRMLSELNQAGIKKTPLEPKMFEKLWCSEKPFEKEIGKSLVVCGVLVYPKFHKPVVEKIKINFGDE